MPDLKLQIRKMPGKIVFIKWGDFSLINNSIEKILRAEFANKELEVIDLKHHWKSQLGIHHYLVNMVYFFKEYGKDFALGHKKRNPKNIYSWLRNTSYITSLVNQRIQKILAKKDYEFSIQTQSIFNAKKNGVPHFIYTDHTTQANLLYAGIEPREYIRSGKFIKNIEQKIYEDASMIFTCGSLVSYSLHNQYRIPQNKIYTVHAGSNIPRHFKENDAKYASKKILFVGVEWERKGGPILISAFEQVLKKHPDATLTIVGCSPKNISLPNCNIVGKLAAEKLPTYYNESAIFCLPTLREPFGIVFVEALHYKLPVVASKAGSIADLVENDQNGYLCNDDPFEYSERLCDLLSDSVKCKKMWLKGFEIAQSKFKWELVGKTMKEKIEQSLHRFSL